MPITTQQFEKKKVFLPSYKNGRPDIKGTMAQIQKIYLGTCIFSSNPPHFSPIYCQPPPNLRILSRLPTSSLLDTSMQLETGEYKKKNKFQSNK